MGRTRTKHEIKRRKIIQQREKKMTYLYKRTNDRFKDVIDTKQTCLTPRPLTLVRRLDVSINESASLCLATTVRIASSLISRALNQLQFQLYSSQSS